MADEGDTKFCSNCKRNIASSNFVMHEIHCRRHIVLCEHCQEPLPRTELEQHFNDLHAKVACEKCGQDIAKEDMENHLSSVCPKKLVQCEFCELTVPQCDLDGHIDYCGSRTERCDMCGQYVMLKDMLQHQSSGCAYPEAKPEAKSNEAKRDELRMRDLEDMLTEFDFDMNHFAAPDDPSAARSRRENAARATTQAGKVNSTRGTKRNTERPGAQVGRNQKPTRKPDINVHRASNLPDALPPDMDYDTMLALQLAHEQWQQEGDELDVDQEPQLFGGSRFNLGDYVPDQESLSLPEVVQSTVDPSPDLSSMTVPCEFCDMEIPWDTYLEHVESCLMKDSAILSDTRNNEVETSSSHQPPRPNIPSIDNLSSVRQNHAEWSRLDDHAEWSRLDEEEDFMLPCEFCEEIFPADVIFQHQSVCQANGLVTPRATTPATKTKDNNSQTASVKNRSAKSRPKRQADPSLLDFVSSDEEKESDLNHLHFRQVQEPSSNKYSSSVGRFDTALSRPSHRATRGSHVDSERTGSGQLRARARLNQLLQEDKAPTSSNGVSRTKAASTDKKKTGVRRTQVDSRTVMSQLERNTRTRVDEASAGASSRTRQRADHVFSPELRLKPDHNPPPKKR